LLAVSSLRKAFDDRGAPVRAVDDVTFDVAEGELFALLGPSGCGKTTLLRCIAGLERPDAGEIVVAGRTLTSRSAGIDVPAHERGLGVVSQSYGIWPHMTVFDTAAFPLRVLPRRRRPSASQIRARVEQVLDSVQLAPLAHRPATDLSGGQQQRLAIARALVNEPPLLLLDEPLASLDTRLRDELRFELLRLQRDLGTTCVYVTHDQTEALSLANRLAVMNDGRIEQLGEPRTLYDHPTSRFVAEFLGAANLIDGVVVSSGHVRTAAGVLEVPAGHAAAPGDAVVVVVRPEHVTLEDATAANGWIGPVEVAAYTGDGVDLVVRVGDLRIRVRSTPQGAAAVGSKVGVRLRSCSLLPAAEAPRDV